MIRIAEFSTKCEVMHMHIDQAKKLFCDLTVHLAEHYVETLGPVKHPGKNPHQLLETAALWARLEDHLYG